MGIRDFNGNLVVSQIVMQNSTSHRQKILENWTLERGRKKLCLRDISIINMNLESLDMLLIWTTIKNNHLKSYMKWYDMNERGNRFYGCNNNKETNPILFEEIKFITNLNWVETYFSFNCFITITILYSPQWTYKV